MVTRPQSPILWDERRNRIGPSTETLPDLSRYDNPAHAPADFQRGLGTGTLAGSKLKRAAYWDFKDESFRLDVALEDVPIAQSMSFAFLKSFAAGFRYAYRARFRMF
jgi:hypothetical protein